MTDEKTTLELFRYLHERATSEFAKFVYFLLALTGSAIAFSAQITLDKPLDESLWALGIAVLCWIVSFYFGICSIAHTKKYYTQDMGFVKKLNLKHIIPHSPEAIAEEDKVNQHSKNAGTASDIQLISLLIGVVFFIVWRIIDMATVN